MLIEVSVDTADAKLTGLCTISLASSTIVRCLPPDHDLQHNYLCRGLAGLVDSGEAAGAQRHASSSPPRTVEEAYHWQPD